MKTAIMDTHMDACEQSNNDNPCKQLKLWWARLGLNQRPDDYESKESRRKLKFAQCQR